MITLQLVAIFSVFTASNVMGIVPLCLNYETNKFLFKLLKVFSGGILLGLSLIHIMPDGVNLLSNIIDYPIGGVFVCSGMLLLILLNCILTHLNNNHEHQEISTHEHNCISILSSSQSVEIALRNKQATESYIMEFGCIFHSLIIGLSTGFIKNDSLLVVMIIALSLHQGFEGIALGTILIKTKNFSKAKKILMLIVYSFITPIGIAIGSSVNHLYDPLDYNYQFAEGSLNCFSCGLLLYVSLYNLLGEEFSQTDSLIKQLLMFLSTVVGLGSMAVLAIWG